MAYKVKKKKKEYTSGISKYKKKLIFRKDTDKKKKYKPKPKKVQFKTKEMNKSYRPKDKKKVLSSYILRPRTNKSSYNKPSKKGGQSRRTTASRYR